MQTSLEMVHQSISSKQLYRRREYYVEVLRTEYFVRFVLSESQIQ